MGEPAINGILRITTRPKKLVHSSSSSWSSPNVVKPSATTGTVKRPGYFEGADGLPAKKQRISNYQKPVVKPSAITDYSKSQNINAISDGNVLSEKPEIKSEVNIPRIPMSEKELIGPEQVPRTNGTTRQSLGSLVKEKQPYTRTLSNNNNNNIIHVNNPKINTSSKITPNHIEVLQPSTQPPPATRWSLTSISSETSSGSSKPNVDRPINESKKKNICTREIQPRGQNIGRRVKKTATTRPTTDMSCGYSALMGKPALSGILSSSWSSSNVIWRPLRERLIHLLAIKPYNKRELFDRLAKEGITEKDRSHLINTLQSISQMGDNTLHLNTPMWNEVQEDWPYCSEHEKQALKRRKSQSLTPPGSSDGGGSSSSGGHSPTRTQLGIITSVTATTGTVKRPEYFDGADGLPAKKHQISHYQKPVVKPSSITDYAKSQNINAISDGNVLSEKPEIKSEVNNPKINTSSKNSVHKKITPNHIEVPPPSAQPPPAARWSLTSISSETSSGSSKPNVDRPINESNNKNVNNLFEEEKENVPEPLPELEVYPEFNSLYTTILNDEQRQRYKDDYDNDYYKEYMILFQLIKNIEDELDSKLSQYKDDSSIQEQKDILKEYERYERDANYRNIKHRFDYLDKKLSHIKKLVKEFDKKYKSGAEG